MSRRQPPWAFAQKVPSFRGAAEGCEPGTHIPEAGVYGFRARRCAAPRNDGFWDAPGDRGAYASAGSATLALAKAGITSVAKRSSCSRQRAFGTPTERLTDTRSSPG